MHVSYQQEEKNMAVVKELIRMEVDGTISFGDFSLAAKSKLDNFKYNGDLYKVKTFREITKLERNGMFVYESVPGTSVNNLRVAEDGMTFNVEGAEDAEITLGLEEVREYQITVNETTVGQMKTNLGGKLTLSVELEKDKEVKVIVTKL